MEEFKSSISRLARLFREGRDNWRKKAIERHKEIRALEVQIRDLKQSRENWKERALVAEQKITEEQLKKKSVKNQTGNIEGERYAKHHKYQIKTIQKALELMINCHISFRGIEKIFELFQEPELAETPCFASIRKWLGRVGLYELTRKREYRSDWIYIVDFTLELGKQKAFVILGIPQQKLEEKVTNNRGSLCHEDVEVLGIELMSSTKGEMIEEALEKISKKVGIPIQIVADNGSDLARGIKLYQDQNPELIYTHDVTHAMALLLKHELEADDRYQSFIQNCRVSRQRLQQTELYFLAPPAQRSQCRFFNVERLTNWGLRFLNASKEQLMKIVPEIELVKNLEQIEKKLGWLGEYELDLARWNQMVLLTRNIEKYLKELGINDQSKEDFEKKCRNFEDLHIQEFQQKIFRYISKESEKLKIQKTFLASSDVIESL